VIDRKHVYINLRFSVVQQCQMPGATEFSVVCLNKRTHLFGPLLEKIVRPSKWS